jgi:G3E family GTPase
VPPCGCQAASKRGCAVSSRLVIVGGFLGAGKTTLILRVAQMLRAQGISPAIITNDQGNDLVDTAQATLRGIPVAEVPAGCFCCRFDALITAAGRLEQEASPQVILAEPVGSCTDLAATVVLPLERMYQTRFTLAPLTIAADARRLLDFVRQDGMRAHCMTISPISLPSRSRKPSSCCSTNAICCLCQV